MQYIHSVTVPVHLVTGLRTCGDTPAISYSNLQQRNFVYLSLFLMTENYPFRYSTSVNIYHYLYRIAHKLFLMNFSLKMLRY
jgi:hypothetical protein